MCKNSRCSITGCSATRFILRVKVKGQGLPLLSLVSGEGTAEVNEGAATSPQVL